MPNHLTIGTRKSKLALWQSEYIKKCLEDYYPDISVELRHIVTTGDRTQESSTPIPEIGGKGLFTAELEEALLASEIDLAVHCLKDLPTTLPAQFSVAAIPERAPAGDVLISKRGLTLEQLPPGSVVGTSSLRRSSQLHRLRPDIVIEHIRGNVDTRIRKVKDESSVYDATLLAEAGVLRLGLIGEITERILIEDLLPAPGQGALGIETRSNDLELHSLLSFLHCAKTAAAVSAEREFLKMLNAGCNTPVAAYASIDQSGYLHFIGRCLSIDGSECFEVSGRGLASDALVLGAKMASEVQAKGFVI